MTDWIKIGTDVIVGGGGGAVSKLTEKWDTDREAKLAAGEKLSFFAKAGNYVDYSIPLLGIIGSFMGFLRGDWETRVITMGSTLAGRRLTAELTKPAVAAWVPATTFPPGAPPTTMRRGAAWQPQAVSA